MDYFRKLDFLFLNPSLSEDAIKNAVRKKAKPEDYVRASELIQPSVFSLRES